MDWFTLVFGIVLGSCITSALVWSQRGTTRGRQDRAYFGRVAMIVALTSLTVTILRLVLDAITGGLFMSSLLFGTGWLVGGLLAAYFLSGPMRQR